MSLGCRVHVGLRSVSRNFLTFARIKKNKFLSFILPKARCLTIIRNIKHLASRAKAENWKFNWICNEFVVSENNWLLILSCRLCEKVVFDDFFGDRAVKVEGVIDGYVV